MAFLRQLAALSLLLSFALPVISLPTISVIGSKFYDFYGKQFFIKGTYLCQIRSKFTYVLSIIGVVYDTVSVAPFDALVNTEQCSRDAALLKVLGANTIRVYIVDTKANHTGCMSVFEEAGIYVLIGLGDIQNSISRSAPKWTDDLYNHFTATIDAFSDFENTLGFFAANELVNDGPTASLAPYIKAIAIDLKAYRDGMNYRPIPIGYGAADLASVAPMLQNYLTCGAGSIDFFGQHDYSWCGTSSMFQSGFDKLWLNASRINIPIFIAETGCNSVLPRTWGEQNALLGGQMNDRFSGAIVYEWAQHVNNYGLVSYSGTAASGVPTPILGDFTNLQSRWATLTPSPIADIRTSTAPPCPSTTAGGWSIKGDASLPTLGRVVVNTRSSTSSTSTTRSSLLGLPTLSGRKTTTSGSSSSTPSGTSNGASSSENVVLSDSGLTTGAIAGIAVGAFLLIVITTTLAFLLWRHRKKRDSQPNLDLTPEGLEVGSPPPKHELDSNAILEKFSERQLKAELPDSHSASISDGTTQHTSSVPSAVISPSASATFDSTPVSTIEARHSQNLDQSAPTAELSTVPATPKAELSSLAKSPPLPVTRRPVPPAATSATWANAPWHSSPLEEGLNQQAPLLSGMDEEDEMKRLDEEEIRVDAKIAESERIRALKEEKAALQAKRAELILARDRTSKQ
ncbi:hypothetical protein VTL71DRAFT_5697 [Oculimacula yallundae]|uniref:1,3-beta-glucanosyltransferase n=1 Tax=Oculimacula yallundae TaxID=86028 RepID=A0ABR4BY83_9HELO